MRGTGSNSKKKLDKNDDAKRSNSNIIDADDDLIDIQAIEQDEKNRWNIDKVKINGKEVSISKLNMKELKESQKMSILKFQSDIM